LETNPTLYFHLHQQRFIELIRKGNVIEALDFAEAELAPRGEENPQFLAELEQTMALLAFDLKASAASPAGAPIDVAELLLPSQRQRTANELNLAILESQRGGKEAKMTTLLRVLVWAEALLSEKADFPRVSAILILRWGTCATMMLGRWIQTRDGGCERWDLERSVWATWTGCKIDGRGLEYVHCNTLGIKSESEDRTQGRPLSDSAPSLWSAWL
jgi:hypothetical protein